ncbi:thioredoxin domain-containing protein [Vampirovibrio sp.]|uniref:thioredoxin domain-containing protein n=1 Tax=Vampirovibrio sp. TaxID=2717857 RepID=UPI00359312F6
MKLRLSGFSLKQSMTAFSTFALLALSGVMLNVWAETPPLSDTFRKEADGKLVLLDFYSDYCGTCQMMAPKLKLMQRKTRDQIVFRHIDVASEANKKYWEQYQLHGTPTYVLYDAQGKPIYKMEALITPVVLEKQLLRHIDRLKPVTIPEGVEIPRLGLENGAPLNQLLLFSFENEACEPCQEMAPFLNGFEISGKPNLKILRLNTNTDSAKKLMGQLNIKKLPAYALLDNSLVSPANLANNRRGELFVMTGKVPPRALWDIIRMFGEPGV